MLTHATPSWRQQRDFGWERTWAEAGPDWWETPSPSRRLRLGVSRRWEAERCHRRPGWSCGWRGPWHDAEWATASRLYSQQSSYKTKYIHKIGLFQGVLSSKTAFYSNDPGFKYPRMSSRFLDYFSLYKAFPQPPQIEVTRLTFHWHEQ